MPAPNEDENTGAVSVGFASLVAVARRHLDSPPAPTITDSRWLVSAVAP